MRNHTARGVAATTIWNQGTQATKPEFLSSRFKYNRLFQLQRGALTSALLRQYSRNIKRIALFVCVAYAAIFVALTWPVILFAFIPNIPMAECVKVYTTWEFWVLLGVLVLCQAGLLLIPLRVTGGRPTSRKHVFLPIIVSGFLVALLALGVIGSLNEFAQAKTVWDAKWERWGALVVFLATWATWSIVFCRITRHDEPKSVLLRQCRRLLQGSVITLLVAVPTHIVARWRGYCCAGFSTFLGITFGIAVMLACFGPGVYFLYAERWRKLHPQKTERSDGP